MAQRIRQEEVLELVTTTKTNVTAHMRTAAAIVAQHLEDKGLSEAILSQIELYLACHFTVLSDPDSPQATVYERLDGAEVRYRGKDGEGLRSTLFGQQALALDPTGRLAEAGQIRASLKAIDSTRSWESDNQLDPLD